MVNQENIREVDPRKEHKFEELKKIERNLAKGKKSLRNPHKITKLPAQQDFKLKIKSMVNKYHEILKPTLDNCTRDTTIAEIKERSYLKLLNPVDSYNKCIGKAYDYHDLFKCQNNLLNFFETKGLEFAKQLAREY